MTNRNIVISLLMLLLIAAGCRSTHQLLETGELTEAEITVEELIAQLPRYGDSLRSLSGNGRLLISQPGNSDRLSLDYLSDREASLITFRNRIGMEGGQLLVKRDSILIYNRIDNVAERYSLSDGNLTELGALATMNLTELFHYQVEADSITELYQSDRHYVAFTFAGTRITIDKEAGHVAEVQYEEGAELRYSLIHYEAYEEIDGFLLPRKITIFSSSGDTRLTLLVRSMQVNQPLPELEIELPEDTPVKSL